MQPKTSAVDLLSDHDKEVLLAYLTHNCDMPRALRALGMENKFSSQTSFWEHGRRYLSRLDFRAAIDEVMSERMMSALEVMDRHTEIASADMDDVIGEDGRLDLAKARELGKTRLIKSITTRTWWDKGKGAEVVEVRCELYNAQQAQQTIMKYHGLLAEAIKVKDLPKDKDQLVALLTKHIERTTGRKVGTAAPGGAKGAN